MRGMRRAVPQIRITHGVVWSCRSVCVAACSVTARAQCRLPVRGSSRLHRAARRSATRVPQSNPMLLLALMLVVLQVTALGTHRVVHCPLHSTQALVQAQGAAHGSVDSCSRGRAARVCQAVSASKPSRVTGSVQPTTRVTAAHRRNGAQPARFTRGAVNPVVPSNMCAGSWLMLPTAGSTTLRLRLPGFVALMIKWFVAHCK